MSEQKEPQKHIWHAKDSKGHDPNSGRVQRSGVPQNGAGDGKTAYKSAMSASNTTKTKGKSKKTGPKSKWKSKPAIVAYCVLGFLLALCVTGYAVFSHYVGKMNYKPLSGGSTSGIVRRNNDEDNPDLMSHKDVLNVLLIGSDARGDEQGRSDTMMLISLNKKTQEIVMTSFLRDTYLTIPGYGDNRLNAAYAFGGPGLLMDTLEDNFGVRIDKYAEVDFQSFTAVIDLVGGVDVKISDDEIEHINRRATIPVTGGGGVHLLNGDQALQYSRIRYLDSDFGRTERQRKVITALFDKAKGMSISQMDDMLEEVLPQITTDFTQGEIFGLLMNSMKYMKYDLVSFRVPIDDSWSGVTINEMSVLQIDFEANRKALQEKIYDESKEKEEE